MNVDTSPPVPDPIFVLSPPLSFSSHFAAMLGQHPQLYAIPEAHLFVAETLQEWWDTCAKTSFNMSHGLIRAVSELFYGEQNKTTGDFVEALPETQKLRVRTEDVLRDPDAILASITEWLAIQSDGEAIDAMKHPERSPYARFGPEGARYGDDAAFLRSPSLPEPPAELDDLDTPFSWRDDGGGFSLEVRALARTFGYD